MMRALAWERWEAMRRLGVVVALAALAMGILASSDAQTLLLTLDTPNPRDGFWFSYSLALGDVNGDGKVDIAVGAPFEDVSGNLRQGRAYVFSGADGSLFFTLNTPNPGCAEFGYSMALGDVNGDGKADIAVGAQAENVGGNESQGRVYVFSGVDASLLLTLDMPVPQRWSDFGSSVAMGDVNSDGKADIAVGAPAEEIGQGRAYVFAGTDGSLLFTLNTPNPGQAWFGNSLGVGDVNADGKADITVGAPLEWVGGNDWQGRAYVFSGADGSLLFTLDSLNPQSRAQFGNSLAVGDVNADGNADIAVGAPLEWVSGNDWQGRVYVFSGADGSVLFTLDTPNPQAEAWFGNSLAAGDVNADSKADIAVGAPLEWVSGNDWQGRAYVFSGADGSVLFTLDTPNPQAEAWFGNPLALGDVSGDGKTDIAVGAEAENVGGNKGQGRAYVFSFLNQPPSCSAAAPSVVEIWPPNHKMVGVNVLGVTDPDRDPVSIVIVGITQDEPVSGLGGGDTSPDGAGVGADTAQVRAERASTRNVPSDGRMYHIHFEASDGRGGACSGVVNVRVPHDQRFGHVVVDGGELFDSTVP